MSQNSYTEHPINWQGIAITVRYCRNWLSAFENVRHIEVVAESKEPLPITESGYRSHFMIGDDELAEFEGCPAAYVTAWLDHTAKSKKWQPKLQGELF